MYQFNFPHSPPETEQITSIEIYDQEANPRPIVHISILQILDYLSCIPLKCFLLSKPPDNSPKILFHKKASVQFF